MKARALIECTVDIANPTAELAAVISAVLGSIPEGQRESVLRGLDEEIGVALAGYETKRAEASA